MNSKSIINFHQTFNQSDHKTTISLTGKHILNKFFDNIYVLYISSEEIQKIKPKIDKRNIMVEYFKGFDGQKNKKDYNLYAAKHKLDGNILNPGSYGHIRSFISIIEDAINKNYNKILILEPDIYFCNNFAVHVVKYLQMDYKILYLGASQNKFYKEETWQFIEENYINELNDGYYYAYKTLGTFAIAIDKSIFREILGLLKLMQFPSDVSLVNIQSMCGNTKDCIVAYPNLICCDVSKSKTSSGKNQVDTMKILKWGINYDFEDKTVIKTDKNNWLEIEININSFLENFKIIIMDSHNNCIFPHLTNKTNKFLLKNGKIITYFYNADNYTIVIFKNIFVNGINFKKIEKKSIGNKIVTNAIKKSKDIAVNEISEYFLKNKI